MSKLNKLLIITTIASFLMLIAIIFLYLIFKNKKNRKTIQFFNKVYNQLSRIKLFSGKLQNIRTRIYNNTLDEDWLIKYKSIVFYLFSWIVGIASAIFVVIYFRNNLYVTFTLLFFCIQIKEMFLDLLIGNDTNFLISLSEYSVELQQAFSLTKDVRSAILEANNNSDNYNLVKRMEEVEKILDDQLEFEEYLQDCPNDYLKLLLINCGLVAEHGDKKDADGKSIFLENIFYNNENIDTEVFKRKQLEYWLKGMKVVCIVPLLAFSPYELWAGKFLAVTDMFYKTKLGFISKISITFISIVCFYIIQNLEKSYRKKAVRSSNNYWEEYFFRIPIVKKFIVWLTPKKNSMRGYRYRKLISDSGEFTRVEYIYLRKVLLSILAFVVSLSINFSIHKVTKVNILNNQIAGESSLIVVKNGEQVNSVELENKLLQYVDLNDIPGSYELLISKLNEEGVTEKLDSIAKKIILKQKSLENEGIRLLDVVVSLIISIVGYNSPELLLTMKKKLRRYEMENEVIIFETIILIFMYHENATSEVILEYMSKFADIFKPQVDKVLKDIKKSDFEALEIQMEEMKYKPFLNIIKNLIKAENIDTKDAFISLADNRRNYLMNRKEENRRIVQKSVSTGSTLSLIPINLIIMVYIAIPMLYVSFVQLDTTQNQIMEIESRE